MFHLLSLNPIILGKSSTVVRQGDALVSASNKHHRGGDQGAKVDEGLSQESVETAVSSCDDHSVAQHRVHLTGQDMIDAPDVIAEVAQLETTFSHCLCLVRVPLCKTLRHLGTSGKMIH
jgi:hypothetical protein